MHGWSGFLYGPQRRSTGDASVQPYEVQWHYRRLTAGASFRSVLLTPNGGWRHPRSRHNSGVSTLWGALKCRQIRRGRIQVRTCETMSRVRLLGRGGAVARGVFCACVPPNREGREESGKLGGSGVEEEATRNLHRSQLRSAHVLQPEEALTVPISCRTRAKISAPRR